jgi:hypothetical protein
MISEIPSHLSLLSCELVVGLATELELFGQEDILTFCRNQNAERLPLGAVAGVIEELKL